MLVDIITEVNNWKLLREKFKEFSKNKKIQCLSMPVVSLSSQTDKAEQVSQWWHEVEQKSIELALNYEYLIKTDIIDCYSAIYTHSIVWGIHSKQVAKDKRREKSLLGNQIDSLIQDMCLGQTNGIPQGSVLMDFIAEIVLGYADTLLTKRIEEEDITNYRILRYRDDYRIFVKNPQLGEKIVKILTEVMIGLGLKLNPEKTDISDNVVRSSIKEDKLAWLAHVKMAKSFQKRLLTIHSHSIVYHNSGSLVIALMDFNRSLAKRKSALSDSIQLISIVIDIAYRNPRTYAVSAAIVSKLLSLIDDDSEKIKIINKIKKKFNKLPNTGYMEIWLQRVSILYKKSINYAETLCKIANGKEKNIWNLDFISDKKLKGILDASKIIDIDVLDGLSPVIPPDEIELFIDYNL